jgi:hypothetical protein
VVAPSITADPKDSTAALGGPVSFSVTATGTSLEYSWLKGTDTIAGAHSATYSIAAAGYSDL